MYILQDTHQYYTSRTLLNQLGTHYYVETDEIQNTRVHDTLSGSHRIASVSRTNSLSNKCCENIKGESVAVQLLRH